MLNKILTTPLDDIVELVKNNNNCTVSFVQQKMNLPLEIIEKWLTILEEFKVVQVHYQGMKGFVKYFETDKDKQKEKEEDIPIDINQLKELFMKKSYSKNINSKNMKLLWPKFISTYESEIKEKFQKAAVKRGLNQKMIQRAWQKYKGELMRF